MKICILSLLGVSNAQLSKIKWSAILPWAVKWPCLPYDVSYFGLTKMPNYPRQGGLSYSPGEWNDLVFLMFCFIPDWFQVPNFPRQGCLPYPLGQWNDLVFLMLCLSGLISNAQLSMTRWLTILTCTVKWPCLPYALSYSELISNAQLSTTRWPSIPPWTVNWPGLLYPTLYSWMIFKTPLFFIVGSSSSF